MIHIIYAGCCAEKDCETRLYVLKLVKMAFLAFYASFAGWCARSNVTQCCLLNWNYWHIIVEEREKQQQEQWQQLLSTPLRQLTVHFLQEGMRHNALHIAAKTNQAAIVALVLDTLLNVEFTKLLYSSSHDTEQSRHHRIAYLVDLYLNSPDKGVRPTNIVAPWLLFSMITGASETCSWDGPL